MGRIESEIRGKCREVPGPPEVPGNCLVWEGEVNPDGYGVWRRFPGGGVAYAHRVMFQAVRGKVGKGMEVHHRCRVRSCCNVNHLVAMERERHRELHGGGE